MSSVTSANAVLLPTFRSASGRLGRLPPEYRVAPLFALPSFTPEFLCRSHPSLDALGVREKSEGKESLRRLASNTPNA
jgi:hypothetical protein